MNQYASLKGDEMENHLSNYLVSRWSVSSVKSFNRNQKEFEKGYIYGLWGEKKSVSSIVGNAYHVALMEFFMHYRDSGEIMSLDEVLQIGHRELFSVPAKKYKPSTSKTVDQLQADGLKHINSLIENFLGELEFYLEDIQEILFIETIFTEFITLADADIPLPVKLVPDLVYINKKGYLCAFDHKSRGSYTKKEDVNITCSQQAITYSKGISVAMLTHDAYAPLLKKYPKMKEGVKHFYYYENKYSKNKDGSNQIRKITINLDDDSVIYEAMLLEGVWKMLQAVSNPDHVYNINQDDYYCDRQELFDFWMKTRLEGLDGFPNLTERQKKLLSRKKEAVDLGKFKKPPKATIEAFKKCANFVTYNTKDMENATPSEKIVHRLRSLGFPAKVAHVIQGYSCDTYLMEVGAGVQTSRIFKYSMDIASALDVSFVRISQDLMRYEGKSYLSMEVNKDDRRPLHIVQAEIKTEGGIPIGRDNYGNEMVWEIDSPSSPHLLVAGAPGSGKSVALTTIIRTAQKRGMQVTIIDPKYEFRGYENCEVVHEQGAIEDVMRKQVELMDRLYKNGGKVNHLIVFDEASDCFARQGKGKELEKNTLLLAQKARSAGIHLVLSSQRWSVKVMTGDAKANFTTRLCLTVASEVDSKVMLDDIGAEKLNGKGDALFRSPEMSQPVRTQCYIIQ